MSEQTARVSIVMGSQSDYEVMKDAESVLSEWGIPFETGIVSAHRTPLEMMEYARGARARGVQVIIAGAGGAAHLPGMIASLTELPVIGVPVPIGPLNGNDALLSIVQMPKGVPVATVAIGSSTNAALLAVQILAAGGRKPDSELLDHYLGYKDWLRERVLEMELPESDSEPEQAAKPTAEKQAPAPSKTKPKKRSSKGR